MTTQAGAASDPAAVRRPGLLANSSALFGSRIVVAALGWAGTVLIVRQLDARTFGQFAFVFSLIGLLSFATDLSSSRVIVRALAQPDADRPELAGAYVCLRSALGLVTYATALGFVLVAGYPSEVVLATAIVGLSLIIGSAGGALDAVFQAEVRLGPVALADVLGQLAQLALTIVIALTHPTLLLFVIPALLFDVVASVWKAVFVRRIVVPVLRVRLQLWGQVLRQAAPLAGGTALFALSVQIPVVLLSKLDGFESVGLYGVALKFVALAAFLPSALANPLLPLLVRSWPQDIAVFNATIVRALLVLTFLGGGIVAVFVPIAGDVTAFLYGQPYRPAGLAAAIVVTAGCLTFSTQVGIVVLITVGRHRTFIALGMLSLSVTVVLTLLLVPVLSYEGAAVASAGAAFVVAAAMAALARRSGRSGLVPVRLLSLLFGCAAVAAAIGFGTSLVAPWPVAIVGSAASYCLFVEVTRATGQRGIRSLLTEGSR